MPLVGLVSRIHSICRYTRDLVVFFVWKLTPGNFMVSMGIALVKFQAVTVYECEASLLISVLKLIVTAVY